jgi:hypothetical protein
MVERRGAGPYERQAHLVTTAVLIALVGWFGMTVADDHERIGRIEERTSIELRNISDDTAQVRATLDSRAGVIAQFVHIQQIIKDHEDRLRVMERLARKTRSLGRPAVKPPPPSERTDNVDP